MVDKNTLRKVYLEKRLSLSRAEYKKRNHLLAERLFQYLDVKNVRLIHSFLAMSDKYEVDSFSLIRNVKLLNSEVGIAISKTLAKGELAHYLFNNSTIIKKNSWGIPEPVKGEVVDIAKIDVVFVPLISFDKEGHRIGYGKGYYDRFLKKVPQAKKIGLALTPPLDHIPYSDEMDVRLDACISPFCVYDF